MVFAKSVFVRVLMITGLVLLMPLVAMYFTDEVSWQAMDFMAAGVLLSSFGSVFVLVARRAQPKYRVVIAVALGMVLMVIWTELAVGLCIF